MSSDLTRLELISLLEINQEMGTFHWKKRNINQIKSGKVRALNIWNKRFSGKEAGTINRFGYRTIEIHDVAYKAHRLMWLFAHNTMPDIIDHIDGNPSNNKIENLRNVDFEGNARNSSIQVNNKSGVSGVYFSKRDGLWVASIGIGLGKRKQLGSSKRKSEAIGMRRKAEIELGYHKNHGRINV